ncbi:class A sortase [Listeria welshimeri]|nr:class A sortase [Listeria welshimeri]
MKRRQRIIFIKKCLPYFFTVLAISIVILSSIVCYSFFKVNDMENNVHKASEEAAVYIKKKKDTPTKKTTNKKPVKEQKKVESKTSNSVKKDVQESDNVDRVSLDEIADFTNTLEYKNILKNNGTGTIEFPALKQELPIIEGTTNNNLKVGATTFHSNQTVERGNFVLLGHNLGRKGVLFSDISKLKKEDTIIVNHKEEGVMKSQKYRIIDKKIINYKGTTLLNQTEKQILTLVTCDKPTQTNNRLIIKAEKIKE